MNLIKILELISKIKELEKNVGKPYNSVDIRKARKGITKCLLEENIEFLEIGDFVLKIGYTNKDKSKPYTMIYTKNSFNNYKNYGERIKTMF